MQTLLLDPTTWDLVLDSSGNTAVASEPYALAQDAASACKTFQGEVYYNTTLGIPYWASILGKNPPLSYVKQQYVNAALTVPDVVSAAFFVSSFNNRTLSGQVQVTNSAGQTLGVNI